MMTYRELLSRLTDLRMLMHKSSPNEHSGCMSSYDRASRFDESTGTYREICKVYAANILAGKEVLPLPKPPKKTMTATELGEATGLTAMNVGLLANKYNLKTTAFGQWVYDTLKNGRQVESFRYYESAIPVIKEIAEAEKKDRDLKARVADMSIAELVGDIILFAK